MLFKTLPELVTVMTVMYLLILHIASLLNHIFKILRILSANVIRKSNSNLKFSFLKALGFVLLFAHFFFLLVGKENHTEKTNQQTENPHENRSNPQLLLPVVDLVKEREGVSGTVD